MSEAKFQAARELIEEGHYNVARGVLQTIPNNPTAQEWLAKIDQIAPPSFQPPQFPNVGLPMPPARSQPQPAMQFEVKTVTVQASVFENLDKKVDKTIREISSQGWEYVSQHDQSNAGLWGQRGNGARVLQFRRPRPLGYR